MEQGITKNELVTAGTFQSISLDDARLHLKEPSNLTAEDDLIKAYIRAADSYIEKRTNKVISSSTWAGWLDCWPDYEMIYINKSPISAIDSIQYYNESNVLTILDSSEYTADLTGKVGRIYLESTPDLKTRPNAVKINFTAGYSSQQLVDETIKDIVRLYLGSRKQLRADESIGKTLNANKLGVEHLIQRLKSNLVV